MMKLRSFQRWVLLLVPCTVVVTLLLYFQVSAPAPPRELAGDVHNIILHERMKWQERLRTLREELHQLQQQQNSIESAIQVHDQEVHQPDGKKEDVAKDAIVHPAHVAAPANQVADSQSHPVIAVLVLGCNRGDALKRSITQVLKKRPSAEKFPVIVSLDCGIPSAEDAVKEFGHDVTLIKQPDLSPIDMSDTPPARRRSMESYYKISRHYKFALNEVFIKMKHETVIIVEDDLDIAGDFFEYMTAGERLMVKDKSIWCVSAWNDNGKPDFIDEAKPEILYRTDFFPGLGWMLKKDVWAELSGKWPRAFWDDWMRNPAQRKDRACIRPEISRTFTFGQRGASQGQYWTQHLQFIKMNKVDVEFTSMNLDYLLKDNYDKSFKEAVYAAPETSLSSIPVSGATSVRVTYANNVDFTRIAKQFRLMDDLRAGVPRMAYLGTVPFTYRGQRVYLAPPQTWTGYQEK